MPGFDRVAHVYDATRSLRADVMSKVVDGIVEYLGKSSVVDFGVGTGRFASPLARAGLEVTGLDVSLPMVRQAREKGVARLVLAAAEFAPLKTQSVDYAMVVHFMHLLSDWRTAAREISRVARKGLITVVGDIEGSHPRDLYVQLRARRGFRLAGLKMGEREMIAMVKPSLNKRLIEYREEFDPASLLEEYSAKLHSVTWDIPDEVNTQIVDEMRPKLGARRVLDRSVSLVAWDHDQLGGFYLSA